MAKKVGTERTSVLALRFFRCVPPGENRVLGSQRWKNPQFWGTLCYRKDKGDKRERERERERERARGREREREQEGERERERAGESL